MVKGTLAVVQYGDTSSTGGTVESPIPVGSLDHTDTRNSMIPHNRGPLEDIRTHGEIPVRESERS